MELIRTQSTSKGKESISYNKFIYRNERDNANGERFWRCTYKSCPGRMKTEHDKTASIKRKEHNHHADLDNVKVQGLMKSMRERSFTETTFISIIYREESVDLSKETSKEVCPPHFLQFIQVFIKFVIRNIRQYQILYHCYIFELNCKVPCLKNDFLSFQDNDNGILIFGTRSNLKLLSQSNEMYMDGTFFVVPRLLKQFLTIHVFFQSKQIPLLYWLLDGKIANI